MSDELPKDAAPSPDLSNLANVEAKEFIGFKRAYVALNRSRVSHEIVSAAFNAYVRSATYGSVAVASCGKDPNHIPPVASCMCGFYALKDRDAIERGRFSGATFSNSSSASVLLEVELFGSNVIEGVDGFRASSQQVRSVELPASCRRCGSQACWIVLGQLNYSGEDHDIFDVRYLCNGCVAEQNVEDSKKLSAQQLSAMLGVTCRFTIFVPTSVADHTNSPHELNVLTNRLLTSNSRRTIPRYPPVPSFKTTPRTRSDNMDWAVPMFLVGGIFYVILIVVLLLLV